MSMQFRPVATEFKADAKVDGKYAGYFSIFGNVDDGYDLMVKGAFAKTLQERGKRIKVFYGHDWSKLIGPPPDVLQEDEKGLYAEGRLTLGSFWGREVWELMKDGALTEGSIGYQPIPGQSAYNTDGVRLLNEVKLYEISPVPLGMNPLTEIEAVKSLRGLAPDRYLAGLHALLAELKAGARHSKADTDALNAIHRAVVDLGCTTCKGLLDDEADPDTESPKTAADPARSAADRSRRLRAAGLALTGR